MDPRADHDVRSMLRERHRRGPPFELGSGRILGRRGAHAGEGPLGSGTDTLREPRPLRVPPSDGARPRRTLPDPEHPLVVLPLFVELPLHAQDEHRRRRASRRPRSSRAVPRRPLRGRSPRSVDRLVVVAVDLGSLPQVRGEERPRLHVDGMGGMRRTLGPLERGGDQGSPLVPLGTGMIRTTFRELLEIPVEACPRGRRSAIWHPRHTPITGTSSSTASSA